MSAAKVALLFLLFFALLIPVGMVVVGRSAGTLRPDAIMAVVGALGQPYVDRFRGRCAVRGRESQEIMRAT